MGEKEGKGATTCVTRRPRRTRAGFPCPSRGSASLLRSRYRSSEAVPRNRCWDRRACLRWRQWRRGAQSRRPTAVRRARSTHREARQGSLAQTTTSGSSWRSAGFPRRVAVLRPLPVAHLLHLGPPAVGGNDVDGGVNEERTSQHASRLGAERTPSGGTIQAMREPGAPCCPSIASCRPS
mgnify:CR=1 FL=1